MGPQAPVGHANAGEPRKRMAHDPLFPRRSGRNLLGRPPVQNSILGNTLIQIAKRFPGPNLPGQIPKPDRKGLLE